MILETFPLLLSAPVHKEPDPAVDHCNGHNHVNENSESSDTTKQTKNQSQATTKLCDEAAGEISHLIRQIAITDVTVVIEGESGTGKEIVARAIHERSLRSARPFIAVNCGALHDNLLESELFGHVRGAFTGAISDRKGRFQLAHKGTLFLDEITDLSPKGQGDLLRVLEDSIFRPVGSQKVERADIRLIAATNKSLEMESMNGRFREDLLYRLNVVTINLPPLRERAEDIPHLVESFAEHYCAKCLL